MFPFIISCNSLNRDCQWVHLKRCTESLRSCFLPFCSLTSFGQILTEALASAPLPEGLPFYQASCSQGCRTLDSSFHYLLSGCLGEQGQKQEGLFGIFLDKLHYCGDLGIPRGFMQSPSTHTTLCMLSLDSSTPSALVEISKGPLLREL